MFRAVVVGQGRSGAASYTATFFACWPRLRVLLPDLQGVDPTASDAPRYIQEAVAGYVELRRSRAVSVATNSAIDKHYTLRGGHLDPYHPSGLPEAKSLPAPAELFGSTPRAN